MGDLLTKSSGIVHLSQDLPDLFSVKSMDELFGGQARTPPLYLNLDNKK